MLFSDPLHDEFAAWATGYVTSGGADYGEIVAIADRLPQDADDGAFFDVWAAAGERHITAADDGERAGHLATATGHLLRAAVCYGVAIHVVYGRPVDERMSAGFESLTAAFTRAMLLGEQPGEALQVPFDGYELPGWFLPAQGSRPGDVRPTVIINNGYDATMADAYLGLGRATVERGYHCVLFDGPGQGALLVRDGITMIPDWERVVSAVIDVLVDRVDVDGDRIAIHGWSLGGHLAARAATSEHRLAACVCDPPLWGVLDGMRGLVAALGSPEAAAGMPELSDSDNEKLTVAIRADRRLDWKLIKRGFWVNGGTDLSSHLRAIAPFTLDGRAEDMRCPFLGAAAEEDPLAATAPAFLAKLTCPTTLLSFTAAEGAGGHCEMQNRWLLNQQVLDWLDNTLV